MKIAITIYPDDFAEADRVIQQLRGVRSLELDSYMGKAKVETNFDKPVQRSMGSGEQTPDDSGEETAGTPASKTSTAVPASRPNIDPGYTACQKIGTDTKELLLKELPGRTNDPAHIAKKIKRTAEQAQALIQLLWERDLVKFDGEEFYL